MHRNISYVEYCAEFGWLGPILLRQSHSQLWVGLGAAPILGDPEALCFVPVRRRAGGWEIDPGPMPAGPVPEPIGGDGGRDWLVRALPPWVAQSRVEHLAVLLLYPQGEGIVEPVTKSTFFAVEPPNAADLQAQLDAIDRTIAELPPCPGGLPHGLIHLRWNPREDSLRLALGSCQYPPGIVNQGPGHESWERLGERAAGEGPPDLIVLTGDQIYADATAGLFDPAHRDDRFRKPYETLLSNCHVRDALRRTPMVATLDDHEIDENWEPISPRCPRAAVERNRVLHQDGVKAFLSFQRPPAASKALWFSFTQNRVPVFLLDTRAERTLRAATGESRGMMSAAQFGALTHWLLDSGPEADPAAPKLIVSPAALFPRHRRAVPARLADGTLEASPRPAALRSDGWDGYPETFHALLAFIAQHKLRRLVFLSGDEHLGLHSTATLDGSDGQPVVIHSIHSPGLNIPYRFANATRSELVLDERFDYRGADGANQACTVATTVFEGAGFVMVTVEKTAEAGWALRCEFPSARPLSIAFA